MAELVASVRSWQAVPRMSLRVEVSVLVISRLMVDINRVRMFSFRTMSCFMI